MNIKKILSLLSVVAFLTITSCKKDLSSLNGNNKKSSSATAAALFTYGEKALVDNYTTPSVSVNVFRTITQEWTENTYVYAARYIFSAYTPQNFWWNYLYDNVIKNLDDAKSKFSNDVADASIANNDRIIADILEVYTFHLLTATYGDIPYSEALNTDIPFPSYDSSVAIYKDLQYRLDTCIADIQTSVESVGGADLIYGGDAAQWKKFAATLKLKIAMEIADYDAATAKNEVNKAISAGIFTSNDDNASLIYGNNASTNGNPIWQNLVNNGRHDFCPDSLLVGTMLSWNDPRLPLYFKKYNGTYKGGIAGSSNSYSDNSQFSDLLLGQTFAGTILDYPTVEFLLAEAAQRGFGVSGTVESHYNAAITSSIEFWGGSQSDAESYLSQSSVAWSTATGDWKQKLGYQKWIANFNNSWDAWTDVRRLGYPDINNINPPNLAVSDFPLRFTYPSNESGSNTTNWSAAVAKLSGGKDVVTAKLFWLP